MLNLNPNRVRKAYAESLAYEGFTVTEHGFIAADSDEEFERLTKLIEKHGIYAWCRCHREKNWLSLTEHSMLPFPLWKYLDILVCRGLLRYDEVDYGEDVPDSAIAMDKQLQEAISLEHFLQWADESGKVPQEGGYRRTLEIRLKNASTVLQLLNAHDTEDAPPLRKGTIKGLQEAFFTAMNDVMEFMRNFGIVTDEDEKAQEAD